MNRHHLRKISSEMQTVVTNPISNSMTGSLAGKPLARVDGGLLTVKTKMRPGPHVYTRRRSGRLAFVERDRDRMSVVLDSALARADALFGHEVAYGLLALAAARGHAELELEFIERVHALCEGRANLAIGNRLAHADDHGELR
ncbi:hypothetical protein BCEP4_1960006 [Burkholderia cepacia]|nr:hypothetical protein BCEP4_1960006 [Burkholderia cepacia]